MEREMRNRMKASGLEAEPRIAVVTRLIPETMGTACDVEQEKVVGTQNAHILRVPFHDEEGKNPASLGEPFRDLPLSGTVQP